MEHIIVRNYSAFILDLVNFVALDFLFETGNGIDSLVLTGKAQVRDDDVIGIIGIEEPIFM